MSIFSTILHKIFPADHPSVSSVTPPVTSTASSVPDIAVVGSTQPVPGTPTATLQVPQPDTTVDVEKILTDMAAKKGQTLNWRTSIVDLLKLLDLDSSLTSRTELSKELGYTGDTADSATMNVWLHKEVMNKLAMNGGKVPASLH
jgi:hypothetical protein